MNLESVFNSWASAKVQAVGQFHSPAKIETFSPRDQSSFGQTTLHMAEVAVSRELFAAICERISGLRCRDRWFSVAEHGEKARKTAIPGRRWSVLRRSAGKSRPQHPDKRKYVGSGVQRVAPSLSMGSLPMEER